MCTHIVKHMNINTVYRDKFVACLPMLIGPYSFTHKYMYSHRYVVFVGVS